jgi:hypothetical protein
LRDAERRQANLAALQRDLAESNGQNVVLSTTRQMEERNTEEEEVEEEEEEEEEYSENDLDEEESTEMFREMGGRL